MSANELLRARLRAFTRGGQVVRFHTRPQLHPQSVAAHSYGVAWLCWALTAGDASARLLFAALVHDVPEFITGDLPSPVKERLGRGHVGELEDEVLHRAGLPRSDQLGLTQEEQRLLRLADCLEGMLHCARERSLGNQLLGSCYRRYREAAAALLRASSEKFVWDFINQQHRDYEEG